MTNISSAATTNPHRPRAYSYLRFSTPEQMRGDSHRRQTELATEYARKHGLQLDDQLTYQDLGVSAWNGRNAENGALGDFLAAVRAGLVPPGSVLLVESLDRLSRDKARRSIRLLDEITDHEIRVVTLADGRAYDKATFDADPMAVIWAYMVAMRANDESNNKSWRLKAKWKSKRDQAAKRAMTMRGPAWLRANAARNGFELIPERADVVRRIFQMAAEGRGQHLIAETLNREGVPVFGRGAHWHRSYVVKLLANPAVVGTCIPHEMTVLPNGRKRRTPLNEKKVEGYFPAAVPAEVFQAVELLRASRASTARGRHSAAPVQSIFAGGLAKCPCCNGSMTRVTKGTKNGPAYLVCRRAKSGAGCTYRGVICSVVEDAFIRDASYLLANMPTGDNDVDSELENLDAAMDSSRDRIGRLLDALAAGGSAPRALRERIVEEEEVLNQMVEEQQILLNRRQATARDLIHRRAEQLLTALTEQTLDKAKVSAGLRQLLKEVVVDYDAGTLRCVWRHGGESRVIYAMAAAG